jgi:YidC/Oxa1 family membrane protein insertase
MKVPGAFGFSIISLVVLIRILLHPFFKQQIETAKKMQDIKPHLDKLTAKHKDNPKQLQAEQMKLYQEAGINPATGCVFMVIQIPIFIGLYNSLSLFLTHGEGAKLIAELNKVLYFNFLNIKTIDPNFFGFNLALSPEKAHIWYYYLIPVVTAVLQYFQAKASMPMQQTMANQPAKDKDGKSSGAADFQNAMNTQMKYFLPIMIGYFSYRLPVGLALYYNIFSLFSIIQYRLVHKKVDPVIESVKSTEEAHLLENEIEGNGEVKTIQPKKKNKKK